MRVALGLPEKLAFPEVDIERCPMPLCLMPLQQPNRLDGHGNEDEVSMVESGLLLSILTPDSTIETLSVSTLFPCPFNRFGCCNGIRHGGMGQRSVSTSGNANFSGRPSATRIRSYRSELSEQILVVPAVN
ncbi:hypothetical protein AVEN_249300-1 [Araneus ventricosus]|uniref:Uncharacterized protein n=1 Tax=Araneus ventricosus TaxID=182803 RepID=A0A4Y2CT76_ARAVE|nr:hypothetical protein AVEN_249300-1 [Araneus ventricosus]